jgi:hypothetical protein
MATDTRLDDLGLADDWLILDDDALAFLDAYTAGVRATLDGHWHPPIVECDDGCPMGDPRTAARFRQELDRAQTLGTHRAPAP